MLIIGFGVGRQKNGWVIIRMMMLCNANVTIEYDTEEDQLGFLVMRQQYGVLVL